MGRVDVFDDRSRLTHRAWPAAPRTAAHARLAESPPGGGGGTMTVEWLVRALATGVLLTVAALMAERVAGWVGVGRRWAWAAAMAGSLLLPVAALAAPGALPEIRFPAWGRATAAGELQP